MISPQTASTLVGSLLAQLCVQIDDFPVDIQHEYQKVNPGGQLKTSSPGAQVVVEAILSLSQQYCITLFIDAVDEIDNKEELLDAIETLTLRSTSIKFLVSSRSTMEMLSEFSGKTVHIDLGNKIQEIDQDISLYINGRLRSDGRLAWPNQEIENVISKALQEESMGM